LARDVATFLETQTMQTREIQFLASLPLPVDESSLGKGPSAAREIREARQAQWEEARGIHARSVQLVYPWLGTRESGLLPGRLEPPDALLAGLLANNALRHATWHSAMHAPVTGVSTVEPVLDRETLNLDFPPPTGSNGFVASSLTLRDRVSVIGPSALGFRLLSDVTTAGDSSSEVSKDDSYRPANVNRLRAALLRAARLIGEGAVFHNNGENLWRRLREGLENFLAGLWGDGALAGASANEAFEVRCDRSTMTQADLDAGRVLAQVSFTAAMPIVHVTVVLAMSEGGQVSVVSQHHE
jgi:hypothetical protein